MAQIPYRANLSAARFPLNPFTQGETVIVPGADQSYEQKIQGDQTQDVGIPQVYFMENVLPTDRGFRSHGFSDLSPAVSPGYTRFDNIYELSSPSIPKVYLHFALETGEFWRLNSGPGEVWELIGSAAAPMPAAPTTGTVNGIPYFLIKSATTSVMAKYDFVTGTLIDVTTTGLDLDTVVGIFASNGYLIAWNNEALAWSSLVSPLDFVPSLITGAGGGAVQEAKGAIAECIPLSGGFLLYTVENIVSATYTGNSRYPYTFKEVLSSGTLRNAISGKYSNIAISEDNKAHYVLGESGVLKINLQNSAQILPDASEFILGNEYFEFNQTTKIFSKVNTVSRIYSRIACIASRYLIISYGQFADYFDYAIIYDTRLNRMGRIKIGHEVVAEVKLNLDYINSITTIGFCDSDGIIRGVDFTKDNGNSVIMFGKFQYYRSNTIRLEDLTFELIETADSFGCQIGVSLDGLNETYYDTFMALMATRIRKFNVHKTALNFSILLSGRFNLSSFTMNFVPPSRR